MSKHIQIIGDINNSSAVFINGNVSIDGTVYEDLKETIIQTLKKDLEYYSSEAIEVAKSEIESFLRMLLERLALVTKLDSISKFKKPSMQATLHNSVLGYVICEDERLKDLSIEFLIDRLCQEANSSEESIIDDAIRILPRLNHKTLSLIALMTLRRQMAGGHYSFMLDHYFKQLNPIIADASLVTDVDIDYIVQNNCTRSLPGLLLPFEQTLLKDYDLFFRKAGKRSDLNDISIGHPEVFSPINKEGSSMFLYHGGDEEHWHFLEMNSVLFFKSLRERGQEHLISLVEDLKKLVPPFSEAEVREYMRSINPDWDMVFKLLNKEEVRRLGLSFLGLFIGGKFIAKYTGRPSLELGAYSKPTL